MDILFNSMEIAPRQYPSGLRVENIGYLPHKLERIHQDYECYNFSLILEGQGSYESPGFSSEVVGPCVITQSPGTKQSYGPDEQGWSELFLVYAIKRLPELVARGFWPPPAPMWPVLNIKLFRDTTQQLIQRLKHPRSYEQADYVDRLAEQCVLASMMPAESVVAGDSSRSKMIKLRDQIDTHLEAPIDWQDCAASVSMSLSTFRRQWLEHVGTPPAAYLTRRRMEEAARLLVTSALPISRIAEQVGYPDPLHFSRVYRQHYGMSPRDYRKHR